jgi:hypothetical protein
MAAGDSINGMESTSVRHNAVDLMKQRKREAVDIRPDRRSIRPEQ